MVRCQHAFGYIVYQFVKNGTWLKGKPVIFWQQIKYPQRHDKKGFTVLSLQMVLAIKQICFNQFRNGTAADTGTTVELKTNKKNSLKAYNSSHDYK